MSATQPASRDEAADQLRHMLTELTRPHRHRERYTVELGPTSWSRFHNTRVPPLLVQLESPDPVSGDTTRAGGYESRPALAIDAHDTLIRIDLAAARWVRDLGEDDPGDQLEVVGRYPAPSGPACPRCKHTSCARIRRGEVVEKRRIPGSGTAACINLIGALLPSVDRCTRHTPKRDDARKVVCCTWHAIEVDVRRWWQQARVITGWDSAPWRPDATCPACGVRGGLRIRLVERAGVCVECREVFGPDEYQQLGEHVRLETEERRRRPGVVVEIRPGQNRGW